MMLGADIRDNNRMAGSSSGLAPLKRCRFMIVAAAALVAGMVCYLAAIAIRPHDRSALWHIVHDQCLPHWQSLHDPAPCARVDMKNGAEQGTVILKDRNGVAQFLAMPTRRITGIESPELEASDAPNLFAAAWDARTLVFERLGKELSRDGIGLAINSSLSRSQDQAHIHIDCLSPDVRNELAKLASGMNGGKTSEPVVLAGIVYKILRIDGSDLNDINPFKQVVESFREAKNAMGRATIVVVGETFAQGKPGFFILADFADLSRGDIGHGEDLLDHSCLLAKVGAISAKSN